MGYEVKLLLAEVRGYMKNNADVPYAQIIAQIDLCKISRGRFCAIDSVRPEKPQTYFYGIDGNAEVVKDCYDNFVGVYPAQDVLTAIIADNVDEYRRYSIAIAMLTEALKHFPDLVCITYGH